MGLSGRDPNPDQSRSWPDEEAGREEVYVWKKSGSLEMRDQDTYGKQNSYVWGQVTCNTFRWERAVKEGEGESVV